MNNKSLLEYGKYYHIYNRCNNGQNIFFDPENYTFFLNRFHQYISPFCDIIAWVLLKNHFHILVYVKSFEEINIKKLEYTATETPKKIDVHLQFGHFLILMLKPLISDTTELAACLKKILKEKKFLQ